jgi:hypothetical protein
LPTKAPAVTICRMSPRQRKILDPASLNGRFGVHFQGLVDGAGLTVAELRSRLATRNQTMTESGIRKWLRGDTFPSPLMMEVLAEIFGLSDYRDVLPAPPRKRRSR